MRNDRAGWVSREDSQGTAPRAWHLVPRLYPTARWDGLLARRLCRHGHRLDRLETYCDSKGMLGFVAVRLVVEVVMQMGIFLRGGIGDGGWLQRRGRNWLRWV